MDAISFQSTIFQNLGILLARGLKHPYKIIIVHRRQLQSIIRRYWHFFKIS